MVQLPALTEPCLPTGASKPLLLEPTHRLSHAHLLNPGDISAARVETDCVPSSSAQAALKTRTWSHPLSSWASGARRVAHGESPLG